MNDKSGFILVGNWTTLDNWGATQSNTMLVQPVSAVWPTEFFTCYTVQTWDASEILYRCLSLHDL